MKLKQGISPEQSEQELETYPVLVLALVLVFLINALFIDMKRIEGRSMLPRIAPSELVLVSRLSYGLQLPFSHRYIIYWGGIHEGDIIIFRSPRDQVLAVKRCVGLPGMRLHIENQRLLVGERQIPLSKQQIEQYRNIKTVPEGHFFVVGDNYAESIDSRDYGFINLQQVYGKVILF